ncbi:hypothetical protein RN001_003257 [Aquatica leii]|uniref:Endonuclease-reverse transcriptase n=1 Tax=Aquatica leii TaxID=1421715 RepID=A0AAN7PQX0_9COLE|nr:hypothetical protein RN001_003257 [Aquatica leii]
MYMPYGITRCSSNNSKTFSVHLCDNLNRLRKLTSFTLIRPVVVYASETWTMTKKEEEELRIFERKIIRQILGPINTGENEYRPRMNFEIRDQMKGEDIVNYIESQQIKWLGHVMRKDKTKTIRIVTEWKPTENRKRGKPIIKIIL